ncbi:MAG: sodium:calcium antiporter [candidate division WOR-3 bacterium]|nr:sodium:calcium antiporter [candidate division WOR-3 bacterium]
MNFPFFILFILGIIPPIAIKLFHIEVNNYLMTLLSGISIVSAGFILSIASEVAQKDVPRSFATVFLALIAILPEYAVDIYLAYQGGKDPQYAHYALANMTGANRLLVGAFWPVVLIAFVLSRLRTEKTLKVYLDIHLEKIFLIIATFYGFFLYLKSSITIADAIILILIFLAYGYLAGRQVHIEPDFEDGVQKVIANLPKFQRVFTYVSMFIYAGIGILFSAKPFAEGLIKLGKDLGIDEFFLIQWVAPFASESPELVIVLIFALRGFASWAIGTLISSEVNQLTLLIAAIPIAFSFGAGNISVFSLNHNQAVEVFLTVALSFFAVMVVVNNSFNFFEALLILFAFLITFPLKSFHFELSIVFIIFGLFYAILNRSWIHISYSIMVVFRQLAGK